jgi:hypothetical protein
LTRPSLDNPNLLARMTGIVIRPRRAFAAVVARPGAAGVLAMLTAVSFAASAGFIATDVGRIALIDQWERTALAFGQRVDDARYAEMRELARYRVPYAAATAVARGPVAAVAIAAVLYVVFALRGGRATFGQVLAVVAYSGVILTLRDVVAAPVNYVRESLASPVSLVQFFGMVDEASPLARLFAMFDLFMLWWIVVLAIGLAVLYRAQARTIAATLLAAYVGVVATLAGIMAVLRNS